MASEELQLTIFTYGLNEKRVEIELRPRVPSDIIGHSRMIFDWANDFILGLGNDVKHTNNWPCYTCGNPARETNVQVASWSHLSPPRMVLYIHHLCEAGGSSCRSAIMLHSKSMYRSMGVPPPREMSFPDPEGDDYPLAASCLGCQKDETTARKVKLSRCAGCKLVRYCGTECQTSDWRRHKKVCKVVKSVKWVNWD